jgi:prolyl oligopeptidase
MRAIVSLLALSLLCACSGQSTKEDAMSGKARLHYPVTRQGEQVDHYFGQAVADPYRWLEDDRSPETEAWVKAQNAVTRDYLAQIRIAPPSRRSWPLPGTTPRRGAVSRGALPLLLQERRPAEPERAVAPAGGQAGEVFLDPNTLSPDGTTALDQLSFSRDGRILAYSLSLAGSDWREIHLMDVRASSRWRRPSRT